jgi:PIN domain nuclease of toxin-antitoxin system
MVVLDTHALLWLVDEPVRLSNAARTLIQSEDRIGIAAISGWEVGMLVEHELIRLDRPAADWLAQALARPRVEELPLTAAIALQAAKLPDRFPRDPADRLIYATARAHGAQLVTRDERLADYDPAGTVW